MKEVHHWGFSKRSCFFYHPHFGDVSFCLKIFHDKVLVKCKTSVYTYVLMEIYLQWSKWLGPWKIYHISKICSKNCILVLCQKPKLCYRILYIKTLLLHESSLYQQWNLTVALGDTQNEYLAEYLTWLLHIHKFLFM